MKDLLSRKTGELAVEASNLVKKSIVINAMDTSRMEAGYLRKTRDVGLACINVSHLGNLMGIIPDDVGAWEKAMIPEFAEAAKTLIAGWRCPEGFFGTLPDVISPVWKADDILRNHSEGKLGVMFGFQGTGNFENELRLVRIWHWLGIRTVGLTYQARNSVGDGAGERTNCGLTNFGVQLVEELNRVGMVIDLSHGGAKTAHDAIEISRDPVVYSHSNARALCDTLRNVADEEIKAMAEKGGVMGISGFSPVVKKRKHTKEGRPTVDDYLDHVEYVAKLVGIDHVGIGLDINANPGPGSKENYEKGFAPRFPEICGDYASFEDSQTEGFTDPSFCFTQITAGLMARGYSGNEIGKVLGGNLLRLFKRVWK